MLSDGAATRVGEAKRSTQSAQSAQRSIWNSASEAPDQSCFAGFAALALSLFLSKSQAPWQASFLAGGTRAAMAGTR
jgi:hypothetical protein